MANPPFRNIPVGVCQKSTLATINYEARRFGIDKRMSRGEALKHCPDLTIVNVEETSLFRGVSRRIYALLQSYVWSTRAERLNLDEVWLDVTDMVQFTLDRLDQDSLTDSFFFLSPTDPSLGFAFDATTFSGHVFTEGPGPKPLATHSEHHLRLGVASHLANHLRARVRELGYTSSCGIATNKLLAKLAGNEYKPDQQTTVLGSSEQQVRPFMDRLALKDIPGVGEKTLSVLRDLAADVPAYIKITVGEVRTAPLFKPAVLNARLSGPGFSNDIGIKIWKLLHGIDEDPVKPACPWFSQIGRQNTYFEGLYEMDEIEREIVKLTTDMLKQMREELVVDNSKTNQTATDNSLYQSTPSSAPRIRWIGRPQKIALCTQPRAERRENKPADWGRHTRSANLPAYATSDDPDPSLPAIAAKLTAEVLMPLFAELQKLNASGREIGLIEVHVTKIHAVVPGKRDRKITEMFEPRCDRDNNTKRLKTEVEVQSPVIKTEEDHFPLFSGPFGDPLDMPAGNIDHVADNNNNNSNSDNTAPTTPQAQNVAESTASQDVTPGPSNANHAPSTPSPPGSPGDSDPGSPPKTPTSPPMRTSNPMPNQVTTNAAPYLVVLRRSPGLDDMFPGSDDEDDGWESATSSNIDEPHPESRRRCDTCDYSVTWDSMKSHMEQHEREGDDVM